MKPKSVLTKLDRLLPKNPIWRFMVVHWGQGMLIGAVVTGAILTLDIGHLRTLMVHSNVLIPAGLLLFVGFATTFGGVLCASAVMGLEEKPEREEPELGVMIPVESGMRVNPRP
jgi:hypothetical protein